MYDLFVIGGGSGGVRAARWSASLGAKVAICEVDRYGGTCVIRGCVPKKLMVYASHFREELATARGYGWQISNPVFNWKNFKQERDQEVSRLSAIYETLLNKHKVDVIHGKGVIKAPGVVAIGDQEYKAKNILIATGGKVIRPDIPGIEHTITSNEIFELEDKPQNIVFNGVGYIGLEFASIMHGLGSQVKVIARGDGILRGFDRETSEFLKHEMQKKGIEFLFNTNISHIEKQNQQIQVNTDTGKQLETQAVFMATGRIPNTRGIGLEELGVNTKPNGAISVNENYQTNIPGVLAVGDSTDRMNLTPIATAEGTALAEHLFGKRKLNVGYEYTPSAVFAQPPLATTGYTEHDAREHFGQIDIYQTDFKSLKHALSGIDERFFLKLIVETSTGKVVGAHTVGADAPEMMQGIAIAINAGATKSDFDKTIGIHPTIAEEFCTLRSKREI